MSAEFAQACDFKFATLKWFAPVPGLGPSPELCHDRGLALPHPWDRRGLALPHPWDCVGVTVALGVPSVIDSGLAYGRCTRAHGESISNLVRVSPSHHRAQCSACTNQHFKHGRAECVHQNPVRLRVARLP